MNVFPHRLGWTFAGIEILRIGHAVPVQVVNIAQDNKIRSQATLDMKQVSAATAQVEEYPVDFFDYADKRGALRKISSKRKLFRYFIHGIHYLMIRRQDIVLLLFRLRSN